MALKIRLSRIGTKHKPVYRVVVAEERSRRDGDATEILGTYTPEAKGNTLQIKLDRVDYWYSKGARPPSPPRPPPRPPPDFTGARRGSRGPDRSVSISDPGFSLRGFLFSAF